MPQSSQDNHHCQNLLHQRVSNGQLTLHFYQQTILIVSDHDSMPLALEMLPGTNTGRRLTLKTD